METKKNKKLKVYVAGKISLNSVLGISDWRDSFCSSLSEKTGFEIFNLDPIKSFGALDLDENNSKLKFGRNCYLIKSSDLVIVYLTDDISVGGSQDMLLAKYFGKPLIGLVPKGGKFNKKEIDLFGNRYKNWIHPYVNISCDIVVEDLDEMVIFIQNLEKSNINYKDLLLIEENLEYYEKNYSSLEKFN